MTVEYIPLLQVQRELYRIPRGKGRFRAYLRQLIDWDVEQMRLPLFALNPMGKDHVPTFLDALLAFDADHLAAEAVRKEEPVLGDVPGEYRVALVVADDRMGGWTNRFASEHTHRFESGRLYDRGWLIGILWTADIPSPRGTHEEVLTAVHRLAYVRQRGPARTLREKMAQEGHAMARAGCSTPALDAEDLAYSRAVIAPFLETADMRTAVECLYGDAAGRTLGFTPRGLSDRAGLAVALDDGRRLRELAEITPRCALL
jgi:hypothetical protein